VEAAQPSFLETALPFIVMIGVFYFLIIRPQSKKQREAQNFLTQLKRGDEIVTSSGILGRIEGLTDSFVTVEISDGVRIKMLRSSIAGTQKASIEQAQAKVVVKKEESK
jgi:preprotein translocase subunit YajC